MPYLLTNLPKMIKNITKNSNKLQYPNPIELKAPLKIKREEIDKNFSILEGEINNEGSWFCDIQTEYTGPLYLQVVFVKNDQPIDTFLNILGKFINK